MRQCLCSLQFGGDSKGLHRAGAQSGNASSIRRSALGDFSRTDDTNDEEATGNASRERSKRFRNSWGASAIPGTRRQLAAAQGGHGGQRWRRKLRVEDVAAGVLHLPASHRASHEIAGDYIRIFLEASKMHAEVSAKARRPRPSLGPGGRHPFAHGHPAPFDASAHLPVRLVPVSAVLFLAVVSLVRHSANSDAIDRTGIRGAPVIQQPSRLRQDRASQGR